MILSSNNYLGLCDVPEVVEAGKDGARRVRRRDRVGALHLRHVHDPPGARSRPCARLRRHRGRAELRVVLERERGAACRRCSTSNDVVISRRAQPREHHRRACGCARRSAGSTRTPT